MSRFVRLHPSKLQAIVLDFDGVLTDNKVYIGEDGHEMVCCSRADGLAFDVLRSSGLKLFVLSTETNRTVSARAAKLQIPVIQAVSHKKESLAVLAREEGFSLGRTLYVGNDLNDLAAMLTCAFSACPSDSHPTVRKKATYVLKTRGGGGVVRELVEEVLQMDVVDLL